MGKLKKAVRRVEKSVKRRRENHLIRKEKGRKAEVAIADLLSCNSKNATFRYDIVVRYLAVSEYQKGSDRGFVLYRKMQDRRMGDGFSKGAEKRFKALIRSYDEKGYDRDSYILVDRNLGLIDGSHRMAMALYYGYKNINVLIVDSDHPVEYSIDWFIENGFTEDECKWIVETGETLLRQVQVPFSCVIWAPAAGMADRIVKDLGFFGTVSNVKRFSYRPGEYQNVVRVIYAIDDIERWKIEKKLSYMKNYKPELVSVDLTIPDPAYRIKGATGLPLSTVGERIKRAIRSKYKAEIKDYFFDIILHIGDNMYQSEYMRDVFENRIDMAGITDILNRYTYAFVKTEVPYMPEDFPKHIPVGKDADILCRKEDAEAMIREVEAVCRSYKDYTLVKIPEEAGTRIRMQWGRVLVYQVDISYGAEGLADAFVPDALAARKDAGGYYILDPKYEYIYRMQAYRKKKTKQHHKVYLKEHKKDYDAELAGRYIDCTPEQLLES